MRITTRLRLASALIAGLAVAACSDSPTGPSSTDLATLLNEASLTSLAASLPSTAVLPAPIPSSVAIVPSACGYNASSQSFACPTVSVSGVTMSRSYQLLTASGTPQSAFDAATTAAIRLIGASSGTITSAGNATTIVASDTMTLSGLLSGNHVLDGRQRSRMTSTGQFPLDLTTVTTISGLRLPARAGSGNYPLGGSITSTLSFGAMDGLPPFSSTVTMTFNGTSKVDITNSDGTHCTLDLAASGAGAFSCGR